MASEAKSDVTNGFVMANNPFLLPFGVLTLALLAFLNSLWDYKEEEEENLQFLDLRLESRR